MDDVYTSKNHRINNMRHSKYSKEEYLKLLKWEDSDSSLRDNMEKFNFKKTTAFKKKYSCGGYGGTCGMCKNTYSNGKQKRKNTIIFKDQ